MRSPKKNEIAVDQLMIQSGQVSPMERLGSPCPLAPWRFPDMATIQLRPRFPLEKSPTKHKDHLWGSSFLQSLLQFHLQSFRRRCPGYHSIRGWAFCERKFDGDKGGMIYLDWFWVCMFIRSTFKRHDRQTYFGVLWAAPHSAKSSWPQGFTQPWKQQLVAPRNV